MPTNDTDPLAAFEPQGEHTHRESRTPIVALAVSLGALLVLVVLTLGYVTERAQLRDAQRAEEQREMAEAEERRQADRAYLQAQLDEQATVLCIAIADFREGADDPESLEVLDRAARDLGCAFLPDVAPPRGQNQAVTGDSRDDPTQEPTPPTPPPAASDEPGDVDATSAPPQPAPPEPPVAPATPPPVDLPDEPAGAEDPPPSPPADDRDPALCVLDLLCIGGTT